MDFQTSKYLLAALVNMDEPRPLSISPTTAAKWLQQNSLGPLAYSVYQSKWPDLAQQLYADYYAAMGENDILFSALKRVFNALNQAQIPAVLLKGMAVSSYAYPKPALRTKSDIDIWVGRSAIHKSEQVILQAGYVHSVQSRPFDQYGKIEFTLPGWVRGNIDLHAQMLGGYWLDNAANIRDKDLLLRTRKIVVQEREVSVLSTEDALLHAALHLAINHKFDNSTLRGLTDVAFLSQRADVDWTRFVKRVFEWEVATVIGFVLEIVSDLFQMPHLEAPLSHLKLPRRKKNCLNRFISAEAIIGGYDLSQSFRYYLFQLLLVDSPPKAIRLMMNKILHTRRFTSQKHLPS